MTVLNFFSYIKVLLVKRMSYRRRRPRSAILSNVPSRRSYIEAMIGEEDLSDDDGKKAT